jgi:hypothetical protein
MDREGRQDLDEWKGGRKREKNGWGEVEREKRWKKTTEEG